MTDKTDSYDGAIDPINLKPCPFCGSTNLEVEAHDDCHSREQESAIVNCSDCFSSGPYAGIWLDPNLEGEAIAEEAVRRWNVRN